MSSDIPSVCVRTCVCTYIYERTLICVHMCVHIHTVVRVCLYLPPLCR